MMIPLRCALLLLTLAGPAVAADPVLRTIEGSFEDVATAVEDAIVNAGLVIEGRSPVGAMLARTRADVGGTKDLFAAAEVFTFCSAAVSRAAMERDPTNLRFCPYAIFVYETPDAPGKVVIGHPDYAAQGVPEVAALLAPILEEAASW